MPRTDTSEHQNIISSLEYDGLPSAAASSRWGEYRSHAGPRDRPRHQVPVFAPRRFERPMAGPALAERDGAHCNQARAVIVRECAGERPCRQLCRGADLVDCASAAHAVPPATRPRVRR